MARHRVRLVTVLGVIGVIGVLLLVGCAFLAGNSSRTQLGQRAYELGDDLRWARYEQVLPQLSPELRKRVSDRLRVLGEDLEVMDFDVMGVDVKGEKAVVRLDLQWSLRSQGIVQRTVLYEHWEDQHHRWQMVKLERVRGPAMPLADEPAPVPTAAPDGGVVGAGVGGAHPDGGV